LTGKGAGGGGLDAAVLRRRAERLGPAEERPAHASGLPPPLYRRRPLCREATRARAWARAGIPAGGRLQARQDPTHRAQRPTRHCADSQTPRAGCGLGQGTLGRRDAGLGKARVGAQAGGMTSTARRGRARHSGRRDVTARPGSLTHIALFDNEFLQKVE
jgi:hypothetical protein